MQSLRLMAVKGHMTTHLPNVNQWREQITELQENLLPNRGKPSEHIYNSLLAHFIQNWDNSTESEK